jgi:hypothetical protein
VEKHLEELDGTGRRSFSLTLGVGRCFCPGSLLITRNRTLWRLSERIIRCCIHLSVAECNILMAGDAARRTGGHRKEKLAPPDASSVPEEEGWTVWKYDSTFDCL